MSIMQTYSGVAWNLLNPHFSKIFLCDILTSLERTNRFNGHTRRPLSVLKHSLLVAKLASDEARPWALLHDVHEAYVGDMTTPVAQAIEGQIRTLSAFSFSRSWNDMKACHDIEIWKAFGLAEPNAAVIAEVKRADYEALASEKEYGLYVQRDENCNMWGNLPEPCSKRKFDRCYGLNRVKARKKFINACELYGLTLPPMFPHGFVPDKKDLSNA